MFRSDNPSTRSSRHNRRQRARHLLESCESRVLLAATPVGSVDIFTGAEIAGWAWDSATPATALTVRITIDGTAHDVTANQSRPDLRSLTGTDKVGFFYVPAGLSTGNHSVTIAAIDPATSKPVTLKTGTIKSGPIGVVDTLNGRLSSPAGPSPLSHPPPPSPSTSPSMAPPPPSRPTAHAPTLADPSAIPTSASSSIPPRSPPVSTTPASPSSIPRPVRTSPSPPDRSPPIPSASSTSPPSPTPRAGSTIPTSAIPPFPSSSSSMATSSPPPPPTPRVPDIAVAFNGNGNHGYSVDYSGLGGGNHTIVLREVNSDNTTTNLTTQTLTDKVVGSIDIADTRTLAGWAFDPFAASTPIQIVANLDGTDYPAISANQNRPDLTALPDTNHGFFGTMPTNLTGSHVLKVFAINPDTGARELLGQRQFINNAPAGNIDVANATHVAGWAYDPDFPTESITVLLEVDGAVKAQVVANGDRQDLIATIGSAAHGYDIPLGPLNLASGSHTVDIKGVDAATGVTTLIGTQVITV